MTVAAGAVVITLLGRLVLRHFEGDLRVNALGLLALSYLVGTGAYTWVVFVFLVAGGKVSLASMIVILLGLLGTAYALSQRYAPKAKLPLRPRLTAQKKADWVLAALLAPLFAVGAYVAFWTPIYWSDSVYYYDGLGRILSVDGTIYSKALKSTLSVYGQPALFVQILHAGAHLLSDDRVGVLYAGFYASLVLMFAFLRWEHPQGVSSSFRRWLPSLPSRFITLCFATVPFVLAMGFVVASSLAGAAYFFGGVLVWKRFMEQPTRRLAILAGILFAMCSWTRTEAIYFYVPVLAITLIVAAKRPAVRPHVLAFALPLLALDVSRYAFVLLSGQFIAFTKNMPLPHLDVAIVLGTVGCALLITVLRQEWREWLGKGIVGIVAVGMVIAAILVLYHLRGVRDSTVQLWRLIWNPVWGITTLLVAVAFVSPSLFRRSERLLFLVIVAFLLTRVLLYAHILDLNISDATITHDGNRVLLYGWPLLIYWVSCSKELRGLFFYRTRRRRALGRSRTGKASTARRTGRLATASQRRT